MKRSFQSINLSVLPNLFEYTKGATEHKAKENSQWFVELYHLQQKYVREFRRKREMTIIANIY